MLHSARSQWSSGSMPDCSARGPGIALWAVVKNHCDLQPWARAVSQCKLKSAQRDAKPARWQCCRLATPIIVLDVAKRPIPQG